MNMSRAEKNVEADAPDSDGLIKRLLKFSALADKASAARTALAELRRGLRDDPRDRLAVGKYVVPFLPAAEPCTDRERWQEKCCYLVAALLASHPPVPPRYQVSLGAALGEIQEKSGSMEGRFLQLLAVRPDRLDNPDRLRVPLRQAVSLLAANGIQLDWHKLLTDLWQWNHDEKRVQQRWARDFYKASPDRALDPALDAATTTNDDTTEGEIDED